LGVELALLGIRVNGIASGWIAVEGHHQKVRNFDPEAIGKEMVPCQRLGKLIGAARACVYLASDDSDYMVGHVMILDGGFTAKASMTSETLDAQWGDVSGRQSGGLMKTTGREVRWERMFPDELEQAFAEYPVVYFTYGLCEPHGPQNTLGLDALKAHAVACRAAQTHGGIVAPPNYWHIHGLGGYAVAARYHIGEVERSWLTCVPPWIHYKSVCYHIRTADVLGFHAAILITGHYGPNWRDLKTLVDLIQPYVGTRLYGLPDFEANQPGFDNDGRSGGDHAGKVETSLLWALCPECVDVSRLPPRDAPGIHFAMGGDAYDSDRRVGERMVVDEVQWIGAKAQELLEAYDREKPRHTLRTFEDVERLWDTVVRPVVKDFLSMQELRQGYDPPPEDSVWYEHWRVPQRGY
jgi:creatinine amidohydrolase/Fe(II)-dependent formamide hydrolase-like protein